MNIHLCPKCHVGNAPRWSSVTSTYRDDWFVCGNCRHAFRTRTDCSGANRVVTHQSPSFETEREAASKKRRALRFPSPCCGVDGRIKSTMNESDGTWRYHKCRQCEAPYYSLVDNDGRITTMRFKRSSRALEVA